MNHRKRNQMNLNEQLQQAYEAGRRQALSEQGYSPEPEPHIPMDFYDDFYNNLERLFNLWMWRITNGRTRSLQDGTTQWWDPERGEWVDIPAWLDYFYGDGPFPQEGTPPTTNEPPITNEPPTNDDGYDYDDTPGGGGPPPPAPARRIPPIY